MNYATTYPIGNYQHPRTETAKEIAPSVGRVRKLDAKNQRRKPSAERQAEIRADSHASNGFLKSVFLPKLKTEESVQACKKTAKMERDFYKSLSRLAKHYGIEPMQTHTYGYPYNMAMAMWDIEMKLKQTKANWDSFKLIQDSKKTFFVSEERYSTDTTLYYIPVAPLFQMLHDHKRKKTAQLLVSVCSYLYHIADVPYYRQESSYLYWMYETHKDWVEQDEETEDTQIYMQELSKAELIGDTIEQRLFNRINLKVFEQRLNRFKSHDEFDKECHRVACIAFALFTQYPHESIFRNVPTPEEDPYNDTYENETIAMEKYISFIADTRGWLYESLADNINSEFNECGKLEEPIICKQFDGRDITATDLDFENRLFALLDDLCTVLYDYKTIEK